MKQTGRDDFNENVKDLLAKRVGMKCSNPNCRRPTSGPQTLTKATINIGVAAHVTAASPGGPRFDPTLSPEERSSETNGIWLCQNCAKLVDNDDTRYTVAILHHWKQLSEEAVLLEIESPIQAPRPESPTDIDLIRFYSQCFDRPAFQDYFHQEGSMEDFDRAMADTIIAINTGCLRSRDGAVLSQLKGKSFLQDATWCLSMDTVVDLLRAVRSRYAEAIRSKEIHIHKNKDSTFYCIHNPEVALWMDETRSQILLMFGEVCDKAGIPRPAFPHRIPRPFRAF